MRDSLTSSDRSRCSATPSVTRNEDRRLGVYVIVSAIPLPPRARNPRASRTFSRRDASQGEDKEFATKIVPYRNHSSYRIAFAMRFLSEINYEQLSERDEKTLTR
ncbi:PREDICTED: uncharacterized protein LOC105452595 [Wasmannia auropunctata]|uniref:uncharacterized protein LOC105452595 n=1 Tax=Wasmannia auropunctata TaxID=64793 RepID=UPI0005ED7356|nr:PREDICTED: uncharacterized protein LOC105452595 [Wasmannia auropunctata]